MTAWYTVNKRLFTRKRITKIAVKPVYLLVVRFPFIIRGCTPE